MDRARFDFDDDETQLPGEEEVDIDYESDPIDVRDEVDGEQPLTESPSDDLGRNIENAELDNTIDEFVDLINGRDLDGLSDLLADDAQAGFLGESSRSGVLDGLNDLFLRYPTLLTTRGDIGTDPIVAVWIFDQEEDRFDTFGYISLEINDSEEGLIQRIDYVDELSDSEDVVVENPDRSELPEWGDWSQLDED